MLLTFKQSYGIIPEITIKAITTMKLIEDLGTRVVGSKGRKTRFGLYECPVCHNHFECQSDSVKGGHTTKCKPCASRLKAYAAAKNFEWRAREVHGDKYSYYLVDYVCNKLKVLITCNTCGVFQQTPTNHLRGHGCPSCAGYGFNKTKRATLYYLKVEYNGLTAYKIGITNRSVEERFANDHKERIVVLATWEYPLGTDAYNAEQEIMKKYKDYKYIGEPLLNSGNTELFSIDILGLSTTLK